MNKKILIVVALLMVVCVGGAFAWGIGIQGGWNMGIPGNVAITFKLDQLPLIFAGNFYVGDHLFAVGLTGDYWFLNDNIVGPLNWFIGAGAGIAIRIYDDGYEHKKEKTHFGISGRVPVGLNMMLPAGPVEIEPYVQLVPQLWLSIVPFYPDFDLDANIGIRFHF